MLIVIMYDWHTGVQHSADAISKHVGSPPPFNMMLFCQVVEILISLTAFNDKGRRVVEGVLNQIALLWMMTMDAEADQAASESGTGEEKAGEQQPSNGRKKIEVPSKDKLWGMLNFYLALTRHPQVSTMTHLPTLCGKLICAFCLRQPGKRCLPLLAKQKLLGLLNTLVMSAGSAVDRGSVRAQVRTVFCCVPCRRFWNVDFCELQCIVETMRI